MSDAVPSSRVTPESRGQLGSQGFAFLVFTSTVHPT